MYVELQTEQNKSEKNPNSQNKFIKKEFEDVHFLISKLTIKLK